MEHNILNQDGNQFTKENQLERAIWAGFEPVLCEPVVFASINENRFLASSSSGRIIVSREPSWRTEETISNEAALLEHLNGGQKLPYQLPLLLPSKDNPDSPYLRSKGGLWTARRFIAGKSFDWRRANWEETHCRAGAKALAHLHRLSVDETSPTNPLLKASKGAKPVDYEKACLLDLEGLLNKFLKEGGEVQESAKLGAEARNCLENIRQALPFTDQIEDAVWIHGDFHPGNVIFNKTNASVGVIDWDFARKGDRLFDFIYSRLMFAGTFREASPQQLFKPELDRAFCREYLNLIDCPCLEQDLQRRTVLALSLILGFELLTSLSAFSQARSIKTLIEQIGGLRPDQVKLSA